MHDGGESSREPSRRSFALWSALSVCSLAGVGGCTGGGDADEKAPRAHRCPSWPVFGPSSKTPVWPVPFSGLRESLVLKGTWLFGTGTDRVVWLRDARSGRLVWRTPLGKGGKPNEFGQPHYPQLVVARGQVLFGGGNGDATGEVVALCAADGKRMWRRSIPGRQVLEIARSGDVVASATHEHVYGLSAGTGKTLWRTEVDQARWITPRGDTFVLAHEGGGEFGAAGLDRGSGKVLWSESIQGTNLVEIRSDGERVHIIGSRAVAEPQDDGTTVFMPARGEVRTVSLTRHRVQWRRTLPPIGATTPTLGKGLLYLPSGDRLLALHGDSGRTAWSFPLPEPGLNPEMLLHDGLLIVNLPAPDHGEYPVVGLDPETGEERWRLRTELTAGLMPGPAGLVLINTSGTKATAVDTANGMSIWSAPTKGAVQVVGNGLVYAHDGKRITPYDVETGDVFSS